MSQAPRRAERVSEFKYSHDVPVRFSDLDLLGHVNHLAFLDILEQARVSYYHDVMGLPSVVEVAFVLAELRVRYVSQAHFGQVLRVHFRIAWLKRSSSGFVYEIHEPESGELLAEGEGVQVYMDLEAYKAQPLPEAFRARVVAFEGAALKWPPPA
jgi:acyl-CoA thioester hydrolase